jgi:pimeloyl-ACP methyl ester carboxylesterase
VRGSRWRGIHKSLRHPYRIKVRCRGPVNHFGRSLRSVMMRERECIRGARLGPDPREGFICWPAIVRTMKGYRLLCLVTLALLGFITGCVSSPPVENETRSCLVDRDCVPEQCCHPTGCINRSFKDVCTELCTLECRGPIDCGAGHCGCVDGTCQIRPGAPGEYAEVNGLRMYYEIHGEGDPLVLLHGAFLTIDLNYGEMLPALARDRQIIAIELQGHGHTEDIDRPLRYEQMADDTAALLRHLGIEQADIMGYSMGGTTAVELAIRHPEVVRSLVIISSPYNRDGWYPVVYETIENITPELFTGSGLPEAYVLVAPNPGNWTVLVEKVKELDREYVGRTAEEFASIQAPALIIIGDSDGVPPEQAAGMFRLLGGGVFGDVAGLPRSRLAILPGSTHVTVMQRTDWLVPMITEFLNQSVSA